MLKPIAADYRPNQVLEGGTVKYFEQQFDQPGIGLRKS